MTLLNKINKINPERLNPSQESNPSSVYGRKWTNEVTQVNSQSNERIPCLNFYSHTLSESGRDKEITADQVLFMCVLLAISN